MDPRRRGTRRGHVSAVVLLVLALLAVAAASGARGVGSSAAGAEMPLQRPARSASPTPPAPAASESGTSLREAAGFADVLQRRGDAVLRRDRAAWLATLDTADGSRVARTFRSQQAQLFDRIVSIAPRHWTYRLAGEGPPVPAGRRAAPDAAARALRVTLAYRLPGDTRDVERAQQLTVVPRGGRWYVTGATPGGVPGGAVAEDLWDVGPIAVARGERSLVVGAASRARVLPRIAREADAAAARVDRVWGSDWPRTVVVLVPGSLAQMAALLHRPGTTGLDQVAAVTSGELQRGGPAPGAVADRVVLNPVAFEEVTAVGRSVVLTHEITHVATRASVLVAPPLWVEEGFADYVAYRDSGLTRSVVAADLVARVRAGDAPSQLPDAQAFDPARGQIGPAYAGAWLAMHAIADRHGQRGVVRFYRLAAGLDGVAGAPLPSAADALDRAFREVLGEGPEQFEDRWRRYLRTVSSEAG